MDCSIEDCTDKAVSRGWCSKHYTRWQRHGSPLTLMPPAARAKCGTYSGYQAHNRRDETPCDECRQANSDYHQNRRATNPTAKARDQRRNSSYSKALWRLAREYPQRFNELVEQVKAEVNT